MKAISESFKIPEPAHPAGCGSKSRWEQFQKRLGMSLPHDYMAFIDMYGAGLFGDLIYIFSPFIDIEFLNLEHKLCNLCELGAQQRPGNEDYFPYPYFPVTPGLLPWASDKNGGVYYWLACRDSTKWTVVVRQGGLGFESFDHSMTTFLAALVKNKLGKSMAGLSKAMRQSAGKEITMRPIELSFVTPLKYLNAKKKPVIPNDPVSSR